jgi:phosphopantothenoylcysteine decarboxylase / phosphopantothenate---cysteine ligase
MLSGKKILIGITGSIAAYKIPLLVRSLIREGAEVKVIMTPAATDFVSKLTLSTLSKNSVFTDLFNEQSWTNHVMLGRWADVMIIAPLSCNTLSKMRSGQCDNLLMATYLSATCPVVIAPAMDEDMWHHQTTISNLEEVQKNGCKLIPAEFGELASGLIGDGRMAEPETIHNYLVSFFERKQSLKGKKALVTAGPTYEALDPVRFIGNHSSGKMGYAIAEELAERGAEVTLISGPVHIKTHSASIELIKTKSAEDMYKACIGRNGFDITVMAAAVADYAPVEAKEQKIKKSEDLLNISFKKTTDILSELGARKKEGQVLVGFALETENEEKNALKKLKEKNADLIVLNSLNEEGAGFGVDTNAVTLFLKSGISKKIGINTKKVIAKDIVDTIHSLLK